MKIILAGSSGPIGQALVHRLRSRQHTVQRLVRRSPRGEGELQWNPSEGVLDPALIDGADAVINLAGANIGQRLWTRSRIELLYSSRLTAVRTLVGAMERCSAPPRVFLSQSASGYYGDRGDEPLPESAGPGSNLLADLCTKWEQAALLAPDATRVCVTRSSLVFSVAGGALPLMLLPLRLGFGGPLGSGRQWLPWISLEDEVRAFEFLLDSNLAGPVNLAAPGAATMEEVMAGLGAALHRPSRLRVPAAVLEAGLGELARELLLASARLVPERLTAAGFSFVYPDIPAFAATLAPARGQPAEPRR